MQNLLDARQSGNQSLERMARERLRLWGIDEEQIDEILQTGKPITHVTIRSPIRGHVIKKYQVEGEYVEEGARLYDVADLSTVWIEAQVYEDEVALLKEGLLGPSDHQVLPQPRVHRQAGVPPSAPGRHHPDADGAFRHGQPEQRLAAGDVRHGPSPGAGHRTG